MPFEGGSCLFVFECNTVAATLLSIQFWCIFNGKLINMWPQIFMYLWFYHFLYLFGISRHFQLVWMNASTNVLCGMNQFIFQRFQTNVCLMFLWTVRMTISLRFMYYLWITSWRHCEQWIICQNLFLSSHFSFPANKMQMKSDKVSFIVNENCMADINILAKL